jgi:hypothetical protein
VQKPTKAVRLVKGSSNTFDVSEKEHCRPLAIFHVIFIGSSLKKSKYQS